MLRRDDSRLPVFEWQAPATVSQDAPGEKWVTHFVKWRPAGGSVGFLCRFTIQWCFCFAACALTSAPHIIKSINLSINHLNIITLNGNVLWGLAEETLRTSSSAFKILFFSYRALGTSNMCDFMTKVCQYTKTQMCSHCRNKGTTLWLQNSNTLKLKIYWNRVSSPSNHEGFTWHKSYFLITLVWNNLVLQDEWKQFQFKDVFVFLSGLKSHDDQTDENI